MSRNLISLSNENGSDGSVVVHRFNVITTPVIVYNVWERTSGLMGNHSSITRFDEEFDYWFGELTSRRLPADLDCLRAGSVERIEAVREWRAELNRISVEAIFEAFPHLRNADNVRISDGEVEEICQNSDQAAAIIRRR